MAPTRAIALIQRDHGERKNRRTARWKYTIRRLGLEAVQRELRESFGIQLKNSQPVPIPPNLFFLGWNREAGDDERYWLGVAVLSGRLKDGQRAAVREAVAELGAGVRLTSTPARLVSRAPLLGEHNREIATRLMGFSDEEFEALAADGIFGTVPAAAAAVPPKQDLPARTSLSSWTYPVKAREVDADYKERLRAQFGRFA